MLVKTQLKKIPGLVLVYKKLLFVKKRIKKDIVLSNKKPAVKNKAAEMLNNESIPSSSDIERVRKWSYDSTAVWATLEQRLGNDELARKVVRGIHDSSLLSDKVIKRMWSTSSDLGRHDIALDALNRISIKNNDLEMFKHRIEHIKYSQTAYSYYESYIKKYQHKNPLGHVVVFDLGSRVTTGLMVPISLVLLKQGYSVSSAVASTMPKSDLKVLSNVSAVIRTNGFSFTNEPWNSQSLRNEWVIDWPSGIVSCDGVNYFTFFLERISKLERSYRGTLASERSNKLFDEILKKSDVALSFCKNLLSVAEKEKPVRVVTMDTHFAPWGVVRKWCEVFGAEKGIHLIGLSIAYENYFSNLTSIEASTISVEDMTARSDLRHPFLGGRYRFEKFLEKVGPNEISRENALSWINVNRSRTNSISEQDRAEVLGKVSKAREQGKKVFCLMGKVLIDFAAPDDVGNVYADFETWINDLIRLSSKNDAILIIKPHPHEIRSEIVQEGVQCLREILPKSLPESVIYLDHSLFNSSELASLVDTAFVWNGTVCAEFPVLGCPVIGESIWSARDYPLNQHIINNEEDYIRIFNGKIDVPLSEDTIYRAIAHLHFMKCSDVAIPLKYVKRAGTNQSVGANVFYDEELALLEKEGDSNVEKAASRFFEFI
ncbi:hypothetical protein [Franzmannia qiaohouensis]|uniref:Capsule polysaccharide biosynthesis protein n=1 Tax=Franzmannia qiaohouensis TaxID=1329370 RepID=A0ABU1HJ54_9GAMM|nr:hypothetical protein [Halomonas qiaohouensis]MDR5907502.1 hypothetical protein [Halomonas qiaohouensis]